jgi:hypothetical protein
MSQRAFNDVAAGEAAGIRSLDEPERSREPAIALLSWVAGNCTFNAKNPPQELRRA